MDVVVYLALIVLASVFLVSLLVLILMCQRRRSHVKSLAILNGAPPFSKLRNENLDSINQLSPLIAQVLERNQWVYEVTGVMQHSVALLRIAHTLSEKLSSLPLNQVGARLDAILCEATRRVLPRFDDLLSSVAESRIDIRVVEARASALATSLWALALPFTIADPAYQAATADSLAEMDAHLEALKAAVEAATKLGASEFQVDENEAETTTTTVVETSEGAPLLESHKESPDVTPPADPSAKKPSETS